MTNHFQSYFIARVANMFFFYPDTYISTAIATMPSKKDMPSDDVLNALFERLIVSPTSKIVSLGVTEPQHMQKLSKLCWRMCAIAINNFLKNIYV